MFKRTTMFTMFVAATLFAVAAVAGSAAAQQSAATAELEDTDGNPVGTATFTEGPEGVVIDVVVESGVEPGEHGIHIHETGEIEPDFEAAGDHFNPTDAEHGFDNPEGPHAGDLENITVSEDGTANYQTVNDRIMLGEGENSILGGDGTALVIHDMPDDNVTDDDPETGPGMSGDRVAAGVIEADVAAATEVPDTGGPGLLAAAGLAFLAIGSILIVFLVRRSAA
ncbi:MAG: superoxide dismutase family protein [Actinomycetota bacterium]|jgi:Cu-Zn family superoxide dismutase|nr:superoxide dismutase family protein [Rubrobacter sp.]MDQ3508764.1 superoxide dismutase family protein [Actinomycetota bacterium]